MLVLIKYSSSRLESWFFLVGFRRVRQSRQHVELLGQWDGRQRGGRRMNGNWSEVGVTRRG